MVKFICSLAWLCARAHCLTGCQLNISVCKPLCKPGTADLSVSHGYFFDSGILYVVLFTEFELKKAQIVERYVSR